MRNEESVDWRKMYSLKVASYVSFEALLRTIAWDIPEFLLKYQKRKKNVVEHQKITANHSKVKWSEVAQSCPILFDLMDCSLPGFSVHGILQARILESVTISFSRGSSWPRGWTQVFCIGRWATTEVPILCLVEN